MLAPKGFLSSLEMVAATVLDEVYCLPVDDETQLFGGLSLKCWMRGYAFYEFYLTRKEKAQ